MRLGDDEIRNTPEKKTIHSDGVQFKREGNHNPKRDICRSFSDSRKEDARARRPWVKIQEGEAVKKNATLRQRLFAKGFRVARKKKKKKHGFPGAQSAEGLERVAIRSATKVN